MSTIPTVTSGLKTQLDACVSTPENPTSVKTVIKGRNQKNTGFPFVRFYFQDYEDDQVAAMGAGAASDHFCSVRYVVEIVGELASSKVAANKEDDFQNAVETVTAKLEEEWKINTNDVIVSIVGSGVREEQGEMGNVVILSLTLTIRTFRQYT